MKRVAIWAAVSSLPQAKKISLDDQLATGHTHAQHHGAQVVAELIVPGESRNIILFEDACKHIAAYAQLKALIDSRGIDVLIFLDRSRLGRTAALSMTIAELCNRANILLYEIDSPPSSLEFSPANHSDMLIGAIKSVGAQHEIHKITDRHRRGMIGRANSGKFPAKINFGYRAVYNADGLFVEYAINEKAAMVVRLIIKLYLDDGLGTPEIADTLNRAGHDAPDGGLWSTPSVVSILNHIKIYAGQLEYNRRSRTGRQKVTAPGVWPAIIDNDTAQRVRAEKARRVPMRRSITHTYRFSRVCCCGVCGEPMTAETAYAERLTKKKGLMRYESRRYRCRGGHTAIAERRVISAMTDIITKLQDDAYRAGLAGERPDNQLESLHAALSAYNKQIAQLQDAIQQADKDYYIRRKLDAGRYDTIVADAKAEITQVQININRIEEKLQEVEQVANYGDTLSTIALHGLARLADSDLKSANAWFRAHFTVIVENHRVKRIVIA